MEKYKETCVQMVSKVQLDFVENHPDFIDHIVDYMTKELARRLMDVLSHEGEIIVSDSELRVSEYKPLDSVEYRKQVTWSKLVRCKDCKHGRPYNHTKEYVSCEVDFDPIDRDSDFFCADGKRREDE